MVRMSRTLVDLPDDLVRRAMELTRAPSKKAMITRALEELVNREAQLEMIDWVQQGGLPGLTDPDVMADARR
jgi:Arc/MetJ family transcription regulator